MKNLHLLLFIFFFYLLACKKDVGKVSFGNYPYHIGKIISTNCAVSGCHNAQSYLAAGDLNLESWESLFKGSNNGMPVIPFSSKYSSLCYFINTYPSLGPQNQPSMPLNRAALSYNDVNSIKTWIEQGAPDINGTIKWAKHPLKKKLYAVNQGCSVVSIFDSETQLPIRFIEVGNKGGADTPHQLRISPDGKFWYVVFINNNIIQKFSCETDEYLGQIPLTPAVAGTGSADALNWNTLAISKNGKRAYAVSWDESGALAALDLENMKLLHYKAFVYQPHGIVLNDKNDKIYVTAQKGNYIMEFDTAFNSRKDISLENGLPLNQNSKLDAHDIVLSPNKTDLWITCQTSNEVRVYNINAAAVTSVMSTGLYPQEIVYSSSRDEYFVTCTNDTLAGAKWGSVMRLNAKNKNDIIKLACGFQPHGIAVDEEAKLIYVLSRNQSSSGPPPHHSSICSGRNGFVNFINLNTFTLLNKKVELSVDPYFISAQP